jgi:hypothetical protein
MILAERDAATLERWRRLMRPANPDRVEINGQIHSVPLGMARSQYLASVSTPQGTASE